MSLSRTVDRKGSKVLKVALSAALAVAFTPVAAAPAFATQLNASETSQVVQDALSYTYSGAASYAYQGTFFVDGTTVYAGYTPTNIGNKGVNVMYDMARFFGALYRHSNAPAVNTIRYNGDVYTWQPAVASGQENGELQGSNWVKKGGTKEDTLVKTVVTKIGSGLTDNYASSLTFDISNDDGTTYSSISLVASISMAQVINKDNTKDGDATDLASALTNAKAEQTVRMLSDTITNTQLTLKPGVTLDGYGKSLIHLSNAANNTNAGTRAAILHDPAEAGEAAVIKNLKIEGPNSTPATTESDGTVTRHWDGGEYAVKSYGEHANLIVENIEISRAQSALMATRGGKLTVKGSLKMRDLEFGGIEVSESADSKLILDSTASISHNETADIPFAWIDNGGKIINNTKLELAKVDKTGAGEGAQSKAHYYLNPADSKGAHFYNSVANLENGRLSSENVTLDSDSEYALVKFVPAESGTYCFKSTGTVDAAAGLYTMTSTGALGTKIVEGDDEEGYSFKIFAKLTAGTSYILRVTTYEPGEAINLEASLADAASLGSYIVELPENVTYYDDEELTVNSPRLKATVKSGIDGKVLSADKYNCAIYATDNDGKKTGEALTGKINTSGDFILEITPKQGSQLTDSTYCLFYVANSKNIGEYDFRHNNTLVFANNQVATITALAPKGYRENTNTLAFDERNLVVEGWYTADKDGCADEKLQNAPSAVGNYVLIISPNGKTLNGSDADFNTNSTIDLKFSITRGKVAVPSVRTGLTYTGSAQVGVPTGSNYTLSGTATATNAGTYSCTATLAEGYSWSDGTTAPKTFTWSIAKAKTAVPTGISGLTYNGKVQTGVAKSTAYTLTGTTTATEPGEYTCYATPTANYSWTDGTTATKTVKWTLGKADAAIVASPATVTVDAGSKATVTLKQAGTSAYTVASSDTKVATASVVGSSVTISAVKSGTATVTVSTAATARYAASSASITVRVPKDEDAAGSATTTIVGADGTDTKVTNKFKVTTPFDTSDSDVVPTVAFTGTSAKSGKVTVPSTVTLSDGITYKVTSIAPKAFKNKKITGVVIPKNVTKIGSEAFAGCKKLKTISFHSKVKSIGANALKGTAAKTVTLKSSKLSKTSIKNLVKGSKLTTVKCSGLSKKTKAKYAKYAKAHKKNVKFK